jgi:CheY-like chemotaxis protein
MRILVASEDPSFLEDAARQVKNWGFNVVSVGDGIEAWRILGRDPAPPIAILDWEMAGLTGLEICRMLRSTPHGGSVYVIVAGSPDGPSDLIEAREAGVDDYIAKPLSARELHFRIAKGIAFREGRPRPRFGSIPPPPAVPPLSTPSVAFTPIPPPNAVLVGGRYRLERKIADGAVATVWLALHLSLGINVAIRFVKPEAAEHIDYANFERDARAAAQLRSPHIARIYGHGSHEGQPYIAMEYLGGESLAASVAKGGPLSSEHAVALVDQVSTALSDAHARGIVHRDVRPENIVLVEDPARTEGFAAKLVDFGFVKAALVAAGADEKGSPSYTSPECLRGEVGPTPMLDLWGLAATAFYAITGARPFAGDTLGQVFARVCVDPLPIPSQINPNVPGWFDAWFSHACARDPQARLANASDLAVALHRARVNEDTSPRGATPLGKRPPNFVPTAPASARSLKPSSQRGS